MKDSNWLGTWTMYKREVWRFGKVWNQTLIAPLVSTLLFLAIFMLALGGDHRVITDTNGDVPFGVFIAPGLIMMAVVQNAFANSSSSLILSKIQGTIIDVLMPPLSPHEITLAYMMGAITRGLAVGLVVWLGVSFFIPTEVQHPWVAVYMVLMASMMMALVGVLSGLWSQGFDQMSAITNYIISPLAFLSGTFYSITALPKFFQHISYANPFFYMIDGFRYGMIGHSDGAVEIGMPLLAVMNLILWASTYWLFKTGYRLKS
ncbi:multidrug ABC transporter permease [bacterium]|nr:multidrug ABC transporter permease [bacterium]